MQKRLFSILLVILVTSVQWVSAQGTGLSEYRLGSGDQIRIQVYGEDDLTLESLLSDAGTVSYPFLGEIKVLGMTLGSLEELITQGLKPDYLVNPIVSVSVVEYRHFYITGEVEKPGGFPFQPGLTVNKAISLAGGMTDRASENKMFVIRDNDDSQTPQKILLNTPVMPGDIITIEQSFF